MLTKNAPFPMVRNALLTVVREFGAALWRDVLQRIVRLRPPLTAHAGKQARVILGYLRLAPAAINDRRRWRRGSRERDAEILRWAGVDAPSARLTLPGRRRRGAAR
jgi:hypothetical protein